jgi:hypothetical protein
MGVSEVFHNNFLFINKGKFEIFTKFRGIKVFNNSHFDISKFLLLSLSSSIRDFL